MRPALASLLCLALCAPASAASRWAVPVPGSGPRVVELAWRHADYRGVFVLQGEAGLDRPCEALPGLLRCVVDAGPISSVTLYYDPLPPSCTQRAGVRVRLDDGAPRWLLDAAPGPACVWLPAVRGGA